VVTALYPANEFRKVSQPAPAITLNAVCLSGMEAIAAAADLISVGQADVVVAVGQESMSRAPHTWSGSRAGQRYGAIELVDSLEHADSPTRSSTGPWGHRPRAVTTMHLASATKSFAEPRNRSIDLR